MRYFVSRSLKTIIVLAGFIALSANSALSQDLDKIQDSSINTTDNIIDYHLDEYRAKSKSPLSREEATKRWNSYLETIKKLSPEAQDWAGLKRSMEASLVFNNGGDAIKYNKDSSSVFNVICDGKMQCYSGTSLFLASAQKIWGEEKFDKAHPAVIVTNGHISPGFFRKNGNLSWDLYKIESTNTGNKIIPLGPTKELAKKGKAMRVIQADAFLELENVRLMNRDFKKRAFVKDDPVDLKHEYMKALAKTQVNYDVPAFELEKLVDKARSSSSAKVGDEINNIPVGIGEDKVPPGTFERPEGTTEDKDITSFYDNEKTSHAHQNSKIQLIDKIDTTASHAYARESRAHIEAHNANQKNAFTEQHSVWKLGDSDYVKNQKKTSDAIKKALLLKQTELDAMKSEKTDFERFKLDTESAKIQKDANYENNLLEKLKAEFANIRSTYDHTLADIEGTPMTSENSKHIKYFKNDLRSLEKRAAMLSAEADIIGANDLSDRAVKLKKKISQTKMELPETIDDSSSSTAPAKSSDFGVATGEAIDHFQDQGDLSNAYEDSQLQ